MNQKLQMYANDMVKQGDRKYGKRVKVKNAIKCIVLLIKINCLM